MTKKYFAPLHCVGLIGVALFFAACTAPFDHVVPVQTLGSEADPAKPSTPSTPSTPSAPTKPEAPAASEFIDVDALASWLDEQPVNSEADPYAVSVSGVDLSSTGVSKGDTLKTLYSALTRYVELDLSECTGEFFANITKKTAPNKANIVSVILPESVVSLDVNAFAGCDALVSVTLPKVTFITHGAFNGLKNLQEVVMPEVETLEPATSATGNNGVFYGCEALTSIVMPKVSLIGDYTFKSCSALESITLGSDVPELGIDVFNNSKVVTTIYVPSAALKTYQKTTEPNWDDTLKAKLAAL
jgi:hypothetical protein